MSEKSNQKVKILNESSITKIINHFIEVKRYGLTSIANCPFHTDTHPSLFISESRKLYKCFACGAGGDSINFVMKYKKLSLAQAMREIENSNLVN